MCLCARTTLLTHGPFLPLSSLVPRFLSLLHLKPFLFTEAAVCLQAEKRQTSPTIPPQQHSLLCYLICVPFQLMTWGHSIQQALLGTSNNDNEGKPGRLCSLGADSSLEEDMCVQKECQDRSGIEISTHLTTLISC